VCEDSAEVQKSKNPSRIQKKDKLRRDNIFIHVMKLRVKELQEEETNKG
jgi:hypothetical protein